MNSWFEIDAAAIRVYLRAMIAAEHAHAADRFAHEIGCILKAFPARSRRLMGNPLGGQARKRGHHKPLD
jgi:hypothetical protein